MSLKDIIAFIVYVTPGFLAMQIYRAGYPVAKPSDFSLTAWSVIWGIFILCVVQTVDSLFVHHPLHSNSVNWNGTATLDNRLVLVLMAAGVLFGSAAVGLYRLR